MDRAELLTKPVFANVDQSAVSDGFCEGDRYPKMQDLPPRPPGPVLILVRDLHTERGQRVVDPRYELLEIVFGEVVWIGWLQ
jgi:hypothetical protein